MATYLPLHVALPLNPLLPGLARHYEKLFCLGFRPQDWNKEGTQIPGTGHSEKCSTVSASNFTKTDCA